MVECYIWRKRTINLEYDRVIAYFLLRYLIEDFRLWFFTIRVIITMVVRIKVSPTTATTAAAMAGTLRLEPAVVVTLFEPEPGVVVTAGKRVSTVLDKVVFLPVTLGFCTTLWTVRLTCVLFLR